MERSGAALAAVLLLALAAYAQWRIPAFTRGGTKTVLTRAVLLVVGAAFGLTAATYADSRMLAFLTGFGLVHAPAAVVLMLKGWRGEGRS